MGKYKNKKASQEIKDIKKNEAIDAFKKQNQGIILSDERVQEIKANYEKKEAELDEKIKKLADERELIDIEKEAFDEGKKYFEQEKNDAIKRLKKESDEKLKKAIAQEIQKIKDDEAKIRKEFDDEMHVACTKRCQEMLDAAREEASELVEDAQNKSKNIQDEYNSINTIKQEILNDATVQANTIIDKATEIAAEIRDKAKIDTEKIRKEYLATQLECQDARTKAEQDYKDALKEKLEEYKQKIKELHQQENDLKIKYEDLEMDKEDLELEKESLKILKKTLAERKEKYSPAAVEKINEQLSILTQELEECKKENKMQLERIRVLSRYTEENGTENMEKVMNDLEFYRKENIKLHDQLAEYPSAGALADLRSKANQHEELLEECKEERARRLAAEEQLEQNRIGIMELEQQKKISKTLKLLNDQLKAEIDRNNEIYNQTNSAKFPALCEIDKKMLEADTYRGLPSKKSLSELVEYIRSYGAAIGDGHTKLYYSHAMIRSFIASMASSHLIILQGLSGTGKSSLPRLMKKALNFDNSLIPVQSSWNDNRELLGYDNDFTKKFKETDFTKAVYKASLKKNTERISMIILDEMNLARIEYYFADFLAIMEKSPDDWTIPLVNNNPEPEPPVGLLNGTDLKVSENTWFIGTANRDESTMGITDKVYDRALVLDSQNALSHLMQFAKKQYE